MANLSLKFAFGLLLAICACPAREVAAFHDGGVGPCEGCHTMHNSYEGVAQNPTSPAGVTNRYLLKGSDQSSVCLNCHQKAGDPGPTGFHVSTSDSDMPTGTPPRQLPPGGDFGWLKKSYFWIASLGGTPQTSTGDSHGHNIVAQDYGYFQDSYRNSAPGGTYPASLLGCTSCHDPHGKYRRLQDGSIRTGGAPTGASGSLASAPPPDIQNAVGVYRMLGGSGYLPRSMTAGLAFVYNPPAAIAPDTYNRSESTSQTRVAYGSGGSNWCRNCHPTIHTDAAPAGLKHPSGIGMSPEMIDYYVKYVRDGDLTGIEATSYLSLVPFETGIASIPLLAGIVTTTPAKGPSAADGQPAVFCLSCHRAHASGWDRALRWNNRSPRIVHNGDYAEESSAFQPYGQGRTALEARKAYYDIPPATFASEQNPLCYKCHPGGRP